jgi:hypothetical protein
MNRRNEDGGRFRVLLIGVGDHTQETRDAFCKKVSENYPISFSLLRKIVNRCPIVLKKNLSFRTAETLARALRSFGATVSVEEKRDVSEISLEFEEMGLPQLALESSSFRKTPMGSRIIAGRVRNISRETLEDIRVLIQFFDGFEELITFEEVPLPVQPLPTGAASPFKVVLERDLSIKRFSIGFKHASGEPLAALDRRNKREWMEVNLEEQTGVFPFPLPSSGERQGTPSPEESEQPPGILFEEELDGPVDPLLPLGEKGPPHAVEEERREEKRDEESFLVNFETSLWKPFEGAENGPPSPSKVQEEENDREEEWEILLEEDQEPSGPPPRSDGGREGEASLAEAVSEASCPGAEVSPEPLSSPSNSTGELRAAGRYHSETIERKEVGHASFPWIEDFRKAVETYYKEPRDIFSEWFEAQREKNGLSDSFHSLLTILVHARFDQMSQSQNALENTTRIFKIICQPQLKLEEIPPLEGTQFFSGENWRDLLHRAIPKLQQVAKSILERKQWNAVALDGLIQIIPHMGEKNSRKGIRWINHLIPETVEIDFSNMPILVEQSLYRVASRLGIVDPSFDTYEGKNSMGEMKIQSFAIAAFPQHPLRIEEPMIWEGSKEEGGHCYPVQPHCEECLFGTLCPRLFLHFNPSVKGMRMGQSSSLGG